LSIIYISHIPPVVPKGNKRYRKMVEDRKLEYVNSKRLDKPLVALEIIRLWRAQDPPGRFLKLDSNGTW